MRNSMKKFLPLVLLPVLVTGNLLADDEGDSASGFEKGNLFYSPSVVRVETITPNQEAGYGTGVVVNDEGLVLTSTSSIAYGPGLSYGMQAVKGGKYYEAELLGVDPLSGVAALRVEGGELAFAKKADTQSLEVGTAVTAVGLGPNFGQVRSAGVITAVEQKRVGLIPGGFENFIETDVEIDRMKTGGPLMNLKGEWIGINFQASRERTLQLQSSSGYAIPADMALEITDKLIKGGGTFSRGFLGVLLQEIPINDPVDGEEDEKKIEPGVVVANVSEGTPAEKAGLLKGDVIRELEGEAVSEIADLRLEISNRAPGTRVEFLILREEKEIKIPVTLGELPKRE